MVAGDHGLIMHITTTEQETRQFSKFIFLKGWGESETIFCERPISSKVFGEMWKGFCMSLTGTRTFPSHGGQVPKGLSQSRYSEGTWRGSLGMGGRSTEGSMHIYLVQEDYWRSRLQLSIGHVFTLEGILRKWAFAQESAVVAPMFRFLWERGWKKLLPRVWHQEDTPMTLENKYPPVCISQ